jgi:ATP-binding cassette subfamily B protein
MFYIAAPLVPVYLVMLPIQGWIMYRLAKRVMAYQIEMRGMDEELTARIESMLSGALAVKALGMGGALQETWRRVFDQRLGLDFRNTLWQRGGLLAVGQIQIVGSFLALFYGVHLMDSAALTLGDLLAFLAVSGRITPSFAAIITFLVGMQSALVGVERYYKVHDLPDEDAEFARVRRGGGGGEVRDLTPADLDRIVVANPQVDHGTTVVRIACAFTMERGRHYVWHGPNGAGKTSLALALAGLLPHARGAIRVHDVPLGDFSPGSIRRHVRYVGGEPFWPERPLAESFADGRGDGIDRARLEAVLDVTEAGEVLESLPLGLRTVFDNNGRSLSRGESQRLFLAAALYSRQEVVILDEVLSSVPLPMRRRILRRLRAFSPDTLLVYVTPTPEEAAEFDGEVCFTRRAWSAR